MRSRFIGLWRHPDFLRLWAGQTVSQFGSLVGGLALRFTAILYLDASTAQFAVLEGSGLVSGFLVGLIAGAWVDRLRRRPILIWTDVLRAFVLLGVPAAAALGLLRIEALYAVAFAVGTIGAIFSIAAAAYLPSLVPAAALVEANAALATGSYAAYIVGPGAAGVLIQALTAPGAIAIGGLTFLASALGVGLIRTPEPPAPPRAERRPLWWEIGEGLRTVARDPILRAFLASPPPTTCAGTP